MDAVMQQTRRQKWQRKPAWEKWLLGSIYFIIALFVFLCASLCIFWSVAWPIPSLLRVSHITWIKFPPGTTLVRGYDWNFVASEDVAAEVRIPSREVAAFLSDPHVNMLPEARVRRLNPKDFPELAGHGWNLSGIRHFREASYADGSDTRLLVDLDNSQYATVYIDYDEP